MVHGTGVVSDEAWEAEQAEQRAMEDGGGAPHYATPAPGGRPARGSGSGSQGSGSGGAAAAGFATGAGSPQEDGAGAAGSGSAGGGSGGDGDEEEPPPPPLEPVILPPTFTNYLPQLQIQAHNITEQYKKRSGISTYLTTWKHYNVWHINRYGQAAPRCPYTGLLWLTFQQGVTYISYAAREGRTASQACKTLIRHAALAVG